MLKFFFIHYHGGYDAVVFEADLPGRIPNPAVYLLINLLEYDADIEIGIPVRRTTGS